MLMGLCSLQNELLAAASAFVSNTTANSTVHGRRLLATSPLATAEQAFSLMNTLLASQSLQMQFQGEESRTPSGGLVAIAARTTVALGVSISEGPVTVS